MNTQTWFTRTIKKWAVAPVAIAAGLTLVASPTIAQQYQRYENAAYDYAKVMNVEPIYETYQINNPVEQCWSERVPVKRRHHKSSHDSKTPEVVGAIIGGAVGNQLGKRGGGKARDVATVVGAVLGGSIARDVKHNNRSRRYADDRYQARHYETVERCEIKDSYTTRREVVGYDVAYKYRGNVYHTQMDENPGNKIKVRVTVDPV